MRMLPHELCGGFSFFGMSYMPSEFREMQCLPQEISSGRHIMLHTLVSLKLGHAKQ